MQKYIEFFSSTIVASSTNKSFYEVLAGIQTLLSGLPVQDSQKAVMRRLVMHGTIRSLDMIVGKIVLSMANSAGSVSVDTTETEIASILDLAWDDQYGYRVLVNLKLSNTLASAWLYNFTISFTPSKEDKKNQVFNTREEKDDPFAIDVGIVGLKTTNTNTIIAAYTIEMDYDVVNNSRLFLPS